MTDLRVICVDDAPGVAEDYARLIQSRTALGTIGTNDPDKALDLIRTNPVNIAVLDQRMPKISGTELYRKMQHINPQLKAIMLTGEADFDEAADALQTLDYVRVVNKTKIDLLVPAVQMALARSEAARSVEFEDVEVGRTGFPRIPFFRGSTFFLQMIELVQDAHVLDDRWRLIDEINAGESRLIESRYDTESNFTELIETQVAVEQTNSANLDLSKFAKINSGLNSRISSRMHTQNSVRESTVYIKREELSLPKEPENPILPAVKARSYYSGPETIKLRLRLREFIHAEKISITHFVEVLHHTGHYVKKQVDTLTNGEQIERKTSRYP